MASKLFKEIKNFAIHLRLHYQLFILSGGFLMGGFLSSDLELIPFLIQFINVHLFLFGGATAFNSYWDKDEGPIGGLRRPPKMSPWMRFASIALQCVGLLLAVYEGLLFTVIYAMSMLLFWLYSTPKARWKGNPHKSLVAIGLSTGFNSVLMGFVAAGNNFLQIHVLIAAIGVTLILLSLYPVSQIYQIEEDAERGDQTFAVRYGRKGVVRFFRLTYFLGLILTSGAIWLNHTITAHVFGITGTVIGIVIDRQIARLEGEKGDYDRIMKVKYGTSMGFVLFLLALLILKHFQ